MAYSSSFAPFYDKLNQDVDYNSWAEYLISIMKKYGTDPSLIVDAGCGTGNMTLAFNNMGYDMIGIDLSTDMLNIASEKARNANADILFLNQDMADFELYGTVDGVVSCLDCVNYLTNKRDLSRFFSLAYLYLNPGGIIIFDMNTQYKYTHVLNGNSFVYDYEDVFCVWQNYYDNPSCLCEFDITVFAQSEIGKYLKFHEIQTQRCYTENEIQTLLSNVGFSDIAFYHEFSFSKPKKNSQRVFCAAFKK